MARTKSTRLKEIYAAFVAYMPVLISGMLAGFPAFIIPQLRREIDMDMDKLSWLASLGYLSLILGPVFSMTVVNKYPRKTNLRTSMLLFIIGWTIILISTNIVNLILGSTLCGVAAGSSYPLSTLYVTEICRAKNRGSLIAMVWLVAVIGTSTVYTLEYYLPWRRAVFVIIVLSICGIFLQRTIPESKFWYLMRARKEDAKRSAAWFENTPVVMKEVDILYALFKMGKVYSNEENEKFTSLSWTAIKNLKMRPFLLALAVSVLRCGTGKVLFTVYPINLFADMHTPYNSMVLGIWFGFLNLLCCFFNMLVFTVIDKFNRKNFFYALNFLMITSLTIIIVIESITDSYFKPLPGLRIICMYVYLLTEATGYFCITSIMVTEIIPMMQRGVALSLNYLVMNIVCAVYIKLFPEFERNVSFRTMCAFFLFNVLLVLWIVRKYFPEGRGRMYFGIENILNAGTNDEMVDKMMKEDWLRDPHVQRFFTDNGLLDVDKLDTSMLKMMNQGWLDNLKQTMRDNKSFTKLTIPEDDNNIDGDDSAATILDEFTQNAGFDKLTQVNKVFVDRMKTTFGAFGGGGGGNGEGGVGLLATGGQMFQQQQKWLKNAMQNIPSMATMAAGVTDMPSMASMAGIPLPMPPTPFGERPKRQKPVRSKPIKPSKRSGAEDKIV